MAKFKEAISGDFTHYTAEEREAFEIGQGIRPPPRRPGDEITEQDLRALFFVELPDTGIAPDNPRSDMQYMQEGRRWLAVRLIDYAMYLKNEEEADEWTVKRITTQPYASDIYAAINYSHWKRIWSLTPEQVERELIQMNPDTIIPRFECNRDVPGAKKDPNEKVWNDVERDISLERECDSEVEEWFESSPKTMVVSGVEKESPSGDVTVVEEIPSPSESDSPPSEAPSEMVEHEQEPTINEAVSEAKEKISSEVKEDLSWLR